MWCLSLILAAAPLSFDEALQRADTTPAIEAARVAARQQRDAVSFVAPLSDNPVVTANAGVRTYPKGEVGSPVGPEVHLQLGQNFNLGGLTNARRAVAQQEAAQAAAQWAVQRRTLRLEVARAWLDMWVADASAQVAEEESRQAEELASRVERALKNAAATRVEAASIRAFAAEARVQALDWEGKRVDASARLASMLGLDALPDVDAALPELTLLNGDPAPLHARLLSAEAQTQSAQAVEAAAQWASQLQLSVFAGQEWPQQWVAAVNVGFTLPVFERGEKAQRTYRAQALSLRGARDAAARAENIEWLRMQHELEHTQETLEAVQGRQLPAAEEAATLETTRFERGEATLFELTTLRRQALAARIAAVAARANVVEARHHANELLRAGESP